MGLPVLLVVDRDQKCLATTEGQLRSRYGADRHILRISDGTEVEARAVVLALGVSYRRLEIPALAELEGSGVFYGASAAEAKALAGGRAFVVGGGNSAGQAAMHLARYAEQVTILVRGPSLAASMSSYLRGEIAAADNIEVMHQTEIVGGSGEGGLEMLELRDNATGETSTAAADALFVLIGARPGTEWLPPEVQRDEWGYVLTGRDLHPAEGLDHEPQMHESSLPGVFAVGDVRGGSVKRVASAVGEGSVVIGQAHQRLQEVDLERSGAAGMA